MSGPIQESWPSSPRLTYPIPPKDNVSWDHFLLIFRVHVVIHFTSLCAKQVFVNLTNLLLT